MMRRNLLFVASPRQLALTELTLKKIQAEEHVIEQNGSKFYRIKNHHLGALELEIHLLGDLDGIVSHLRRHQVDLLIYDERRGLDAIEAMLRIRKDVTELAKLWGPDFLFPMRRVVTILGESENAAHRAFVLGRDHVQDVLVAPAGVNDILAWLSKILAANIKVSKEKIGLALNGGGLEGLLYQLGVMCALNEVIEDFQLKDFDLLSGVSSGSIISGLIATGVPIREMAKALCGQSRELPELKSTVMFDLATTDILRRLGGQSLSWGGFDLNKWYTKILRSIPTGVFKGEKILSYIQDVIKRYGGNDHFEGTKQELYIGATDQDSFNHVTFGETGLRDVKISDAIRASCALPPFFTPHKIKGHWYVDGQITKTCNLELVVSKSCRLIFIVDPMKPHALNEPGSVDREGGIYALIQTVKALVYTRFQTTLTHLTELYPDVDFLVFQPDEECAELMSGSPMKYVIRTRIMDLAYKSTLRKLRERYHVYQVKLRKYDLHLVDLQQIKQMERDGLDFLEKGG